MSDDSQQITFRLPKTVADQFNSYCAENTINRSMLIRKLIEQHMREHIKEVAPVEQSGEGSSDE